MLTINGAGGSVGNPALRGLGFEWILGDTRTEVASVTDAWIDNTNGLPGTNSVKSSLSPVATVITAGQNGAYTQTGGLYTIATTAGLAVGDYLYMSHAALTAGFYRIATIANGTQVTVEGNMLSANQSGIQYQVAWRYAGVAGTAPSVPNGQNWLKARTFDAAGNPGQLEESLWVSDAPSGSAYIAIGGQPYTGGQINTATPSLSILSGWTNNGGIATVAFGAHSGTGGTDFRHSDGTTGEKALSVAESNGLNLTAGDGVKTGSMKLRSKAGGVALSVDLSVSVDSTGPVLQFALVGR